MAIGTRRRNRERWARLVEQWHASGLTRAEFCRRNGLVPRTLGGWNRRLRNRPAGPAAPAGFVEVKASVLAPSAPPNTPPASPHSLELHVLDRYRVVVPEGFDAATVMRLLLVLQEVG
jgi:transposase-like protein